MTLRKLRLVLPVDGGGEGVSSLVGVPADDVRIDRRVTAGSAWPRRSATIPVDLRDYDVFLSYARIDGCSVPSELCTRLLGARTECLVRRVGDPAR